MGWHIQCSQTGKRREEVNPSSFHLYSPQRNHKCHTQPEIWQGQG